MAGLKKVSMQMNKKQISLRNRKISSKDLTQDPSAVCRTSSDIISVEYEEAIFEEEKLR